MTLFTTKNEMAAKIVAAFTILMMLMGLLPMQVLAQVVEGEEPPVEVLVETEEGTSEDEEVIEEENTEDVEEIEELTEVEPEMSARSLRVDPDARWSDPSEWPRIEEYCLELSDRIVEVEGLIETAPVWQRPGLRILLAVLEGLFDRFCDLPTPLQEEDIDTVIVRPSDMNGWVLENVAGGQTQFLPDLDAPLSDGSLKLTTDTNNASKAGVATEVDALLVDVKGLSYQTKQNAANFGGGTAAYRLRIDTDGNLLTTNDTVTLVHEPYWQNAESPDDAPVVPGVWQTWDVDNGLFWASIPGANQPQVPLLTNGAGGAPFYTLDDVTTAYPNALVYGIAIGIGSYNPSYDIDVDEVVFGSETPELLTRTTYDFEADEPEEVPECDEAAESVDYTTFDSFNLGDVDGQNGWNSTGAYDQEVVENTYGYATFGCQSLRISNAVTSGAFGDQTFAAPFSDSVGESVATTNGFPEATRYTRYEAQFDIASTKPEEQQPGMFISVSPDRGDGSRMSYLSFTDGASGIDVNFYDVSGTDDASISFDPTSLGTLDRTVPHTIKFVIETNEGAGNDLVEIYIDGLLVHTGTSWENYYRFDNESVAEQSPRILKTLLFRASGTAEEDNEGEGFLFDNLSLKALPSEMDDVTVHIYKYLTDGETAMQVPNDSSAPAFPMTATWQAENIGGGTGNYVLGNYHGQGLFKYAADTSAMTAGADYTTFEITDLDPEVSPVLPSEAQCSEGRYRLVGYKSGATMEDAESANITTTAPVFNGLETDQYVIVVNELCGEDAEDLVKVVATKIVCTDEADLPNWGNGGADITADTAINWVETHDSCKLKSGWEFQWGDQNAPDTPDALTGPAAGYATFTAPTDANGVTAQTIPLANLTDIHLREVLQPGYIPFTHMGTPDNSNDVSAEFYCGTDVMNYDNWDFITAPVAGETYYCVAWNVPKTASCEMGENLIVNGNFETETVTANGGQWEIFSTVAGWMIALSDGLEIWDTFNGTGEDVAAAGSQNAELDGNDATRITQNVTLVPGATYELRFDYSPRAGTTLADSSMDAILDGTPILTVNTDGSANTGNVWTSHATTFVAGGTSGVIGFEDTGVDNEGGGYGPLLDNVALCMVEEPEPEPETCSLTITSDANDYVVEKNAMAQVLDTPYHPSWITSISTSTAAWIWGDMLVNNAEVAETQTFTKGFTWTGGAVTSATLTLASDNSHKVTLGSFSATDAGENNYTATDTYNVMSGVVPGANLLSVEVENFAQTGGNAESNPAGLIYELTLTGTGESCGSVDPVEPFPAVTLNATKIVCESEEAMPNGQLSKPITAETAQAWVDQSEGACRLVEGFEFEWAGAGAGNGGDATIGHVAPYNTFGPTNALGFTSTIVPLADLGGRIETREVLQAGYVPFSNDLDAEFYCANDAAGTDNWEWITGLVDGGEYHCVAFNLETPVIDNDDNDDDNDEPSTYTIGGYKYECTEDDGGYNCETPKSGWTIFANNNDENDDNDLSTVTDENGYYSFEVEAGDWTVSEDEEQSNWQQVMVVQNGDQIESSVCEFAVGGWSEVVRFMLAAPDYQCDFGNYFDSPEEEQTENRRSGGGGTRVTNDTPVGQVLGASTDVCGMYLEDYMRVGNAPSSTQVMKLQIFLNAVGIELAITGIFDAATDAAVREFQAEHKAEVLTPWYVAGIVPHENPTGWVYQLTRWKINNMVCPGSEAYPVLD